MEVRALPPEHGREPLRRDNGTTGRRPKATCRVRFSRRKRAVLAGTFLEIDDLADAITASARTGPALVAIDGPGGSGKSSLTGLLGERLPSLIAVHIDDFYLPSEERRAASGIASAFDLTRLRRQVLEPASASRPFRYQRYDWERDAVAEWIEVEAGAAVIVVEGVYSLERSLRDRYTFSVFCRAERADRLRRGVERDGEELRARWVEEWMPAEDEYLDAQRPADFADVVVDSSTPPTNGTIRFQLVRWSR